MSIVDWLKVSNTQELLLLGALPEPSGTAKNFCRVGKYHSADASAPLNRLLKGRRPAAAVTFIGAGTHRGMLARRTDSGDVILSEGWWWPGLYDLLVFLFACQSADYLDTSEARRGMVAAICFEGIIWLHLEDEDDLLLALLQHLRKLLRDCPQETDQLYEKFVSEYDRAIRGTRHCYRNRGSYLEHLSLVQQLQRLRFLRGRQV